MASLKAHPPTTQIELPNLPKVPTFGGWVTRQQFMDGICDDKNVPAMITGFRTGHCIPTIYGIEGAAIKYLCDTEVIKLAIYSDINCQNELPNTQSFAQGHHLFDDSGQCVMTIKCTAGTTVESVLPSNTVYGTLQYSSSQLSDCHQIDSFHAMLPKVCIPMTSKTSMMMDYPMVMEYNVSPDCSGPSEIIMLSDGYCSTADVTYAKNQPPIGDKQELHAFVHEDRFSMLQHARVRHSSKTQSHNGEGNYYYTGDDFTDDQYGNAYSDDDASTAYFISDDLNDQDDLIYYQDGKDDYKDKPINSNEVLSTLSTWKSSGHRRYKTSIQSGRTYSSIALTINR